MEADGILWPSSWVIKVENSSTKDELFNDLAKSISGSSRPTMCKLGKLIGNSIEKLEGGGTAPIRMQHFKPPTDDCFFSRWETNAVKRDAPLYK